MEIESLIPSQTYDIIKHSALELVTVISALAPASPCQWPPSCSPPVGSIIVSNAPDRGRERPANAVLQASAAPIDPGAHRLLRPGIQSRSAPSGDGLVPAGECDYEKKLPARVHDGGSVRRNIPWRRDGREGPRARTDRRRAVIGAAAAKSVREIARSGQDGLGGSGPHPPGRPGPVRRMERRRARRG